MKNLGFWLIFRTACNCKCFLFQTAYRIEENRAWGVWWMQDGSADVTQIDNEFHRVRYVDWESGKLKNAFIRFEEKLGVGSREQYHCLKKSIVSLYPNNDRITVDGIMELLRKQHLTPPPKEPDLIEENEECDDHMFDADAPF